MGEKRMQIYLKKYEILCRQHSVGILIGATIPSQGTLVPIPYLNPACNGSSTYQPGMHSKGHALRTSFDAAQRTLEQKSVGLEWAGNSWQMLHLFQAIVGSLSYKCFHWSRLVPAKHLTSIFVERTLVLERTLSSSKTHKTSGG